MGPSEALKNLMDGNARFAAGQPRQKVGIARIRELAAGQSPFATILGCSDSRVPVETVFDHEPGDIFAVRIAGNFLSPGAMGSIEYAVQILKSPLVMVLGHTSCGAAQAAVQYVESGTTFPAQIQVLASALAPAALQTRTADDWVNATVAANVRLNVAQLRESPLIADAVANGGLELAGAVYDLSTGKVTLV